MGSILLGGIVQLLGALSVIVAIAATLLGGLLLLIGLFGGSGSFLLQGIGPLEGLVVLGVGNLVCLLLNLAILLLRRWHWELHWLRNLVVRVQLLPAALLLLGALLHPGLTWRSDTSRADARGIEAGLAQGQASAVAAFQKCTGTCQETLDADHQLLLAAQYARLDWAVMASNRGGRVNTLHHVPAQRAEPVLCDNGVVVQYANALELAVIHGEPHLIELLTALTARPFKERALYTAVILGREAAVRHLLASFGWTELPVGLERLSLRPDGKPQLIVPTGPLACQLPSWEQLGFPPEGR